MEYNNWIRTTSRGFGIDGYTDVEIKDMQGTWTKVARFQESDDNKMTKLRDFIQSMLYKGQPFSHESL